MRGRCLRTRVLECMGASPDCFEPRQGRLAAIVVRFGFHSHCERHLSRSARSHGSSGVSTPWFLLSLWSAKPLLSTDVVKRVSEMTHVRRNACCLSSPRALDLRLPWDESKRRAGNIDQPPPKHGSTVWTVGSIEAKLSNDVSSSRDSGAVGHFRSRHSAAIATADQVFAKMRDGRGPSASRQEGLRCRSAPSEAKACGISSTR